MIQEWIESYRPATAQASEQALREVMQEIALAGLYRANFFKHAAFYGGTALRIFHGLPRFSEDLDFSLMKKDDAFELQPYFKSIIDEFAALGIKIQIHHKIKTFNTAIDSAFLKSNTMWSELVFEQAIPQINLSSQPKIKIKLEVDNNPSLPFDTENLLLTKPFSFYVNCFSLPDLFAGKLHALFFRKWKNRVKGRDWYDLEWYIRKGVPMNIQHFEKRAKDSGDWDNNSMTHAQLVTLLENKIQSVDITQVKADIIRFIPNPSDLDIWSKQYFLDLVKKMKVVG